jgi:hypothetical protein
VICLGTGSPGYTYLGCFKDQARGSTYGTGYLPISFSNQGGWTVDQCAMLARDRGYPVFSLQSQSECFLGSVADVAIMIAALQSTTDDDCSAIPCVQAGVPCPAARNKVFFLEGMPHFKHWCQVHVLMPHFRMKVEDKDVAVRPPGGPGDRNCHRNPFARCVPQLDRSSWPAECQVLLQDAGELISLWTPPASSRIWKVATVCTGRSQDVAMWATFQ